MKTNEFLKGAMAYWENAKLSDCPYIPESKRELQWVEGWRSEYRKNLKETIAVLDETYNDADDFYLRYGWIEETLTEAVYNGRKVTLNKPTRGDKKRYKVYVNSGKKTKDGEIKAKKVEFGSAKGSDLRVRKNDKDARKSFAARHNCDTANDKTTARYWSCRQPTSKGSGFW